MNILLVFYVFFNVVDASEYCKLSSQSVVDSIDCNSDCTKTDSTPTNWDEVKKFMNDPNKPCWLSSILPFSSISLSAEYKFNPTSLSHSVLNDKCKNGDIVIVRRMNVKIGLNDIHTSLQYSPF